MYVSDLTMVICMVFGTVLLMDTFFISYVYMHNNAQLFTEKRGHSKNVCPTNNALPSKIRQHHINTSLSKMHTESLF